LRASPERAFQAFTEEIALWWRFEPFFRFTPKSPGVLAFEPGVGGRFTETAPGGQVFEIGRITVWEPGARLAFTWRQASFAPGQDTLVEVRFEPAADGVRVSVEHSGWDAIPTGHAARHGLEDPEYLRRHGTYWRRLLEGLAGA
jgi:uncharacterized protein YndB with AHSA1/START domain